MGGSSSVLNSKNKDENLTMIVPSYSSASMEGFAHRRHFCQSPPCENATHLSFEMVEPPKVSEKDKYYSKFTSIQERDISNEILADLNKHEDECRRLGFSENFTFSSMLQKLVVHLETSSTKNNFSFSTRYTNGECFNNKKEEDVDDDDNDDETTLADDGCSLKTCVSETTMQTTKASFSFRTLPTIHDDI